MRQALKEHIQPLRGPQDDNLKAHAIRKSDLMAASCESIGSFCGSSHPGAHLDSGHRKEPRVGKGRTKGKRCSENTPGVDNNAERQPLHANTGARSLVNLHSDGARCARGHSGCDKLTIRFLIPCESVCFDARELGRLYQYITSSV